MLKFGCDVDEVRHLHKAGAKVWEGEGGVAAVVAAAAGVEHGAALPLAQPELALEFAGSDEALPVSLRHLVHARAQGAEGLSNSRMLLPQRHKSLPRLSSGGSGQVHAVALCTLVISLKHIGYFIKTHWLFH